MLEKDGVPRDLAGALIGCKTGGRLLRRYALPSDQPKCRLEAMTQTVSIFSDDGKQAVFQGSQVHELLFWEGDSSSVQLHATVFARTEAITKEEKAAMYVCRVVAKNLGHPKSGVCHSPTRSSFAVLETQAIIEAATFSEVMIWLFKSYPHAEPISS